MKRSLFPVNSCCVLCCLLLFARSAYLLCLPATARRLCLFSLPTSCCSPALYGMRSAPFICYLTLQSLIPAHQHTGCPDMQSDPPQPAALLSPFNAPSICALQNRRQQPRQRLLQPRLQRPALILLPCHLMTLSQILKENLLQPLRRSRVKQKAFVSKLILKLRISRLAVPTEAICPSTTIVLACRNPFS